MLAHFLSARAAIGAQERGIYAASTHLDQNTWNPFWAITVFGR